MEEICTIKGIFGFGDCQSISLILLKVILKAFEYRGRWWNTLFEK